MKYANPQKFIVNVMKTKIAFPFVLRNTMASLKFISNNPLGKEYFFYIRPVLKKNINPMIEASPKTAVRVFVVEQIGL